MVDQKSLPANFPDRVHILKAIHRGIDQVNDLNPRKAAIVDKAPTTVLLGNGPIDSLGVIHLITSVEDYLKREIGIEITIVGDMFQLDDYPLETIQSLADYVEKLVTNKRIEMQRRD